MIVVVVQGVSGCGRIIVVGHVDDSGDSVMAGGGAGGGGVIVISLSTYRHVVGHVDDGGDEPDNGVDGRWWWSHRQHVVGRGEMVVIVDSVVVVVLSMHTVIKYNLNKKKKTTSEFTKINIPRDKKTYPGLERHVSRALPSSLTSSWWW